MSLLLLRTPRLHNAVAWSIHMASLGAGGARETRPAVLARSVPSDVDQDPGATLVLRGNPGEYQEIAQWLAEGGCGGPRWSTIRSRVAVEFHPALTTALALDRVADGLGLLRIRGRQILQGLVSGACVLRCAASRKALHDSRRESGGLRPGPKAAPISDRLSRRRTAGPTGDGHSRPSQCLPRGEATLRRTGHESVLWRGDRMPVRRSGSSARRDLITRREVADLGNVRSRASSAV